MQMLEFSEHIPEQYLHMYSVYNINTTKSQDVCLFACLSVTYLLWTDLAIFLLDLYWSGEGYQFG